MEKTINLKIVTASMLCVCLAVSLLQLLPSKYYFNFSSIVSGKNTTQFFAYKTHAAPVTYCAVKLKEVDWDQESLPAELNQACKVFDQFDSFIYSVYPVEASANGVRLASPNYRKMMSTYLLAISEASRNVADLLKREGMLVERGLTGLSEVEIDAIFVEEQTVTLIAIIRHMMPDFGANHFDALQLVQAGFPSLAELSDQMRSQLEVDRNTLRQSSDWVPLAEQFISEEYSNEINYLNGEIYGIPTDNLPIAFLLKLLPPLLAGFAVAAVLRPKLPDDIALGAAMVAFLLSWPVVVLWNVVVDNQYRDTWPIMFGLYTAYIFAYYFLAKLGSQFGIKLSYRSEPGKVAEYVDWNKVISTTATSLVTSAVAALLTLTFANAG